MARMGEKGGAYKVLVTKPEERESLESLSVDGGKNGYSRNRMGWR